jgi:diguanylate cyclase (GGDEF)-like protein/PAS domain S-box-containing protein
MVGTNWDITELRVLMNELSREREFLRTTLWSIGEAVVMTDQHLRVIFMNQTAEHLLRCSSLQVTNQPVEQVMKLVDANMQPLPHPLQLAFEQRKVCFLSDETYLSVHGRTIAIQDSAAPIIGDNDALLGGVMVFSDVTQERSLQKELSYQASHDQLTGLINRSAFEMILQDVIKESVMTAGQSALVFLDLDYFKQVNDTAGHAAGDELLKQIAQLMLDCTRSSDIVGRLGGDEFGLIFRHCSLDYANAMMNELIYRIGQLAFQWNEQLFHVGASAGLVVINEHFTSSSSLLANADHACYAAKRAGRGQVKTVSPLFDAHSAD